MNTLIINADQGTHTIDAHIYGHFAEHLGRCIYEGFWVGEESSIANTRGIRNDVVDALKKLQIPNLRWPGGCFADEYHWKDGIGPRENRASIVNTHWGSVTENNHFGTHEFFDGVERVFRRGFPLFIGFQEVGANLAYVALILWTAREHLRHIARRALGRIPATQGERDEALSHPVAFWRFPGSFAFMVGWGVLAGMSWPLSLALWTFYLIIAVVLSRVVAESGLLFVHHSWMPLGALAI